MPRTNTSGSLADWYRSTLGHALVGAILLWAALPPLKLGLLGWIAPVWWVLLIRKKELVGRRPYATLWLAGFLFWLAMLHWLRLPHPATSIGWVALSFYFAFYLPLFVGLSRVAVHQLRLPVVLAAPIVWTGLELAREYVLHGMTMACLGHTQYDRITLIQMSDLAGAFGVSFVVMFVAASLARMIRCDQQPRAIWPLVPAIAVLAAVLCYGYVRIGFERAKGEDEAAIALIQGSIDTQMKTDPGMNDRIHRQYRELSADAIEQHGQPDLIVWPETMFRETLITREANARMPDVFRHQGRTEQQFQAALEDASRQSHMEMSAMSGHFGAAMLIGVDNHHFGPDGMKIYNAAAFVRRDGSLAGVYRKNHRVMFGEYVPFAEYLPWIQRLTPLPVSLNAGTRPASFKVDGLRVGPNICFESVLSRVIRRQVNLLAAEGVEPDVLVNLTNDGWFWGSSELDLHLICGVFRAVECRKPFLIAANTGFSAWIDGDGRIVRQGPRRDTGTIFASVSADPRRSWYLRHGDWPAGICLAACAVFALAGLLRWRGVSPGVACVAWPRSPDIGGKR